MAYQANQTPQGTTMGAAEYLRSEAESEVRREYIDGQVYAMAGASINHNILALNLARKFGNHLEGTPCATFMSDIKVELPATPENSYVYPDVIVDCAYSANDGIATAPVIIVEILSKSTRKWDTSTKLLRYINLPTLKEYVLIEQDIVAVQVLRKRNHWQAEYLYLGDLVTFEAIDLTLNVNDIYDRVDNEDMREFKQASRTP